jgi:hypothetical protein
MALSDPVSRRSGALFSRAEIAVLGALAVWGLAPVILMIVHALAAHARLTGADGPIGADQLQYLSWARDGGSHGLASNLFDLSPNAHVFAQPLFTLSGLLWRLGLPLQLAYLLWKPVAVVALFLGARAWSGRFFPTQPAARMAASILTLFLFTPITALAAWATIGSAGTRSNLLQVAGELFPAGELWGYLPSALAVAALGGMLVSWLHPWQGVTLLLILAGLAVWGGRRDWPLLGIPALATLLPLVYYLLLSRLDSAWKLAAHNELVPRLPAGVLLAGLGPLILVAALGYRRPAADPGERALLLWIPAGLLTYLIVDSFSSHALESLSIPIAVLAVRGWERLRLPPAANVLAVAAVTLPGMAYDARAFRNVANSPIQEYYLSPSESRALDWVANSAPPGGVLAPTLFANAVPSQTGRSVWVGHQFWSRDYPARSRAAEALFDGRLSSLQARILVLDSGARVLIGDCAHSLDLEPALRPILAATHRFGCATVYVVKPGLRPGG